MISRSLLGFVACSTSLFLSVAASAATFTGLYVFGDSLSDRNNVYTFTFGLYPDADYADGRLSNGPLWVETLAESYLGLPAPTASLKGGTNYAYGGASTDAVGLENPFAPFAIPSLSVQTSTFIAGGGSFGPHDLVTVWGGANDFLGGGQTNPAIPVANLSNIISSLADAGAATILVPNLPDLGDTPRFQALGPEAAAAASSLVTSFNALLSIELANLDASRPGLDIVPVDFYSLGKAILADAAAFGFTNVTDAALGLSDGTGYVYWDDVHPTTQAHAEFARVAAIALGLPVPEPGLMCFLSLTGVGLVMRRRVAA